MSKMTCCSELEHLQYITPSRFISFSFPNPLLYHPSNPYGNGDDVEFLRVAVLDSPLSVPSVPQMAAMLVPVGRHHDWIFSTYAGHLYLLLSSQSQCQLSRLILIGPQLSLPAPHIISCTARPDPDPAHAQLLPFLLALSPKAAFQGNAIPDIPLLSFQDGLLQVVPIQTVTGPVIGEMLVEDVAINCSPAPTEFHRRLRFKRMPCLVQTQVRLVRTSSVVASSSLLAASEEEPDSLFQPEVGGPLVQPYLQAMVAGLALIAPAMEEGICSGVRPRCLCAGIGGGSLLMSLRLKLDLNVLGIEADSVVLDVARNHFGLMEDEFLSVCVGDAIQMIQDFAHKEEPDMSFSAILVDLDSSDAMCGVSAPPLEMTQGNVILAARSILHQHGVLILNVIPPAPDGSFYKELTDVLHQVFSELYEVDVGNCENFVLIASVSPIETIPTNNTGYFLMELTKSAGEFLEHIRKI